MKKKPIRSEPPDKPWNHSQTGADSRYRYNCIDTPVALMRGILGSLSFLNLAGRIQPNQRESLPKRISFGMPYRT